MKKLCFSEFKTVTKFEANRYSIKKEYSLTEALKELDETSFKILQYSEEKRPDGTQGTKFIIIDFV